jgi:hypothetical protein
MKAKSGQQSYAPLTALLLTALTLTGFQLPASQLSYKVDGGDLILSIL